MTKWISFYLLLFLVRSTEMPFLPILLSPFKSPCLIAENIILIALTSCVWYFLGYKPVGCYRDTRNRAIRTLEGTDYILDGAYKTRKDPIAKCAVAAMRRGYKMFAVQDGGLCMSSATAHNTYDKYGKSTACAGDGEGGPWANHVHVLTSSCK